MNYRFSKTCRGCKENRKIKKQKKEKLNYQLDKIKNKTTISGVNQCCIFIAMIHLHKIKKETIYKGTA